MKEKFSSVYMIEEGISFPWEITLYPENIVGRNIQFGEFHTKYIITRNAEIYNIITHKKIKNQINNNGYYAVRLSVGKKNGTTRGLLVHRALAMAYIPNYNDYPIINHIDGHKRNLDLDNLEWCTYLHNNLHAYRTGLKKGRPGAKGEKNIVSKHSDAEARRVCELLQKGWTTANLHNLLGYDWHFVYSIYERKGWTHISKDYKFDTSRQYSSRHFTIEECDRLEKLFNEGCGIKEALIKAGFEYTERTRGHAKHLRKKLRKLGRVH